jgi:hypothetical protein
LHQAHSFGRRGQNAKAKSFLDTFAGAP